MKIGIAGPLSLGLLHLQADAPLPLSHENPTTTRFINALLRRGHEVVAYTTSTSIDAPTVLNGPNLTVCVARREPHAARDLFRSERAGLLKLMKEHPADVINAQWSYEFAWAALDAGTPAIVTVRDHALSVLRYQRDMYRFMRLLMNYYVLDRAMHLAVNSDYLLRLLRAGHRRKAKVIPNCWYSGEGKAPRADVTRRESTIVCVANGFGRLKNITTALRGFKIARRQIPGLHLRLAGVGMEPNGQAWAFAREHGLEEEVAFLGLLSNAATQKELASATIVLHPSLEESFGMSVLEAMCTGAPVIGGKTSGNIPFLLDRGRAGVLCDVRSPEAIAAAILDLELHAEKRAELGRSAAAFARERFSENATVEAYLQYYREVA